MDSIPLEMDDIFDELGEDGFNPSRLPDLEEELEPMRQASQEDGNNFGQDGDGQVAADDPELLAKLASMKGASKNPVKRTIPKLDTVRLTGERGIPILPKVFEKIPLKGKNHEVEDLKNIMRHLEHWGHRLFPKMPFCEVLDRCERLGSKKEVLNCVKRIRLDMPILMEDHVGFGEDDDVHREGDDGGEDDVQRRGNNTQGDDSDDEVRRDFTEIDEEEIEGLLRDQEEFEREDNATKEPDSETQKEKTSTAQDVLSDDVKARIERNKQLAKERRAAKLARSNPAPSVPVPPEISANREASDIEVRPERTSEIEDTVQINDSDLPPNTNTSEVNMEVTGQNTVQEASKNSPTSEANGVDELDSEVTD